MSDQYGELVVATIKAIETNDYWNARLARLGYAPVSRAQEFYFLVKSTIVVEDLVDCALSTLVDEFFFAVMQRHNLTIGYVVDKSENRVFYPPTLTIAKLINEEVERRKLTLEQINNNETLVYSKLVVLPREEQQDYVDRYDLKDASNRLHILHPHPEELTGNNLIDNLTIIPEAASNPRYYETIINTIDEGTANWISMSDIKELYNENHNRYQHVLWLAEYKKGDKRITGLESYVYLHPQETINHPWLLYMIARRGNRKVNKALMEGAAVLGIQQEVSTAFDKIKSR